MSSSQTAYNSKHPDVPIYFKADEWEEVLLIQYDDFLDDYIKNAMRH